MTPNVFICHLSDVSSIVELVRQAGIHSALIMVMKDEATTPPPLPVIKALTFECLADFNALETCIFSRKNAAPPSHGGSWQRSGKQWEHR